MITQLYVTIKKLCITLLCCGFFCSDCFCTGRLWKSPLFCHVRSKLLSCCSDIGVEHICKQLYNIMDTTLFQWSIHLVKIVLLDVVNNCIRYEVLDTFPSPKTSSREQRWILMTVVGQYSLWKSVKSEVMLVIVLYHTSNLCKHSGVHREALDTTGLVYWRLVPHCTSATCCLEGQWRSPKRYHCVHLSATNAELKTNLSLSSVVV